MLKGKVALITGGGTGIGRACALRLAQEGVQIAVNYSRSEREARDTQKDVEGKGARAMIYKASVTDDHAVRQMVHRVVEEFGRLDILINSAGTTRYVEHDDLDGLEDEYWNEIMDVNVVGLFRSCRAAAGALKEQKGCIVNITSIAGLSGLGSSIAYAASKAAAISVTKSLARVWHPKSVSTAWLRGSCLHAGLRGMRSMSNAWVAAHPWAAWQIRKMWPRSSTPLWPAPVLSPGRPGWWTAVCESDVCRLAYLKTLSRAPLTFLMTL